MLLTSFDDRRFFPPAGSAKLMQVG